MASFLSWFGGGGSQYKNKKKGKKKKKNEDVKVNKIIQNPL